MKRLLLIVFIISSCSKEQTKEQALDIGVSSTIAARNAGINIPDEIHFTPTPGVYPEGIVFDKFHNRFLVSSFTTGTIGIVSFDGTYTPFIQDPDLHATLGLKIDETNKRLLVVNTFFSLDESQLHTAELRIYDLQTGNLLSVTDLAALIPGVIHLDDDLAIDPQGNIYITDAKYPVVYKIDRNGIASVLFEDQRYAAPPGPLPFFWVGFNGIAYNNGLLLVGFYAGGKLLKIPVNDPDNSSEVQINSGMVSPDGLLLSKDGKRLIVMDNKYLSPAAEVMYLASNDNWVSANLIESFPTGFTSPTTATTDNKSVFVVYSYAHEIFFGAGPVQREFIIQKLPFDNTQGF
jgi:DNA-binding beta-propeller fold protein YncE